MYITIFVYWEIFMLRKICESLNLWMFVKFLCESCGDLLRGYNTKILFYKKLFLYNAKKFPSITVYSVN